MQKLEEKGLKFQSQLVWLVAGLCLSLHYLPNHYLWLLLVQSRRQQNLLPHVIVLVVLCLTIFVNLPPLLQVENLKPGLLFNLPLVQSLKPHQRFHRRKSHLIILMGL